MTDEVFDWGEFAGESNFPDSFKFTEPGMSIVGLITKIRKANFDDGPIPELWIRLDDGTERSVLASQRNLQMKLAEIRPASGDRIAIVFTGLGEAKPGKSAPKLFDVQLAQGNAPVSTAPAPAPAAPAPPVETPAPAPAAASAAALLG